MRIVKESLNEGRHRKELEEVPFDEEGSSAINSDDNAWFKGDDDDEDVDPDEIDVDTSDMEADEIEVEDDTFDDQLLTALSNEVKIPEFSRRTLKFRTKGELGKSIYGVPMAKMKDNAFLFKVSGGGMKKYYLKDIIVEGEKSKHTRAKQVNESIDFDGWRDKL